MYSLDEIKDNYRGFSDSKVENIARNESKGLRKEVLNVLKDEIIRRQLNPSLISWVDTEAEPYEGKERELLIEKITSQTCLKCDTNTDLLGIETNIIQGFLLVTRVERSERILCRSCGMNAKSNALAITFFAGWWSGKGFLLTPFTIIKDLFNFLLIDKISGRIINDFIDEHSGTFRRHGTTDQTIRRMITHKNKSNS